MSKFSLVEPIVGDPVQQHVNEGLIAAVNTLARFIDYGNGVPTHTPTGRALYVRLNGGAGTTLYVWSGAAWAAFA